MMMHKQIYFHLILFIINRIKMYYMNLHNLLSFMCKIVISLYLLYKHFHIFQHLLNLKLYYLQYLLDIIINISIKHLQCRLHFNKMDMKQYFYHCYNLHILIILHYMYNIRNYLHIICLFSSYKYQFNLHLILNLCIMYHIHKLIHQVPKVLDHHKQLHNDIYLKFKYQQHLIHINRMKQYNYLNKCFNHLFSFRYHNWLYKQMFR